MISEHGFMEPVLYDINTMVSACQFENKKKIYEGRKDREDCCDAESIRSITLKGAGIKFDDVYFSLRSEYKGSDIGSQILRYDFAYYSEDTLVGFWDRKSSTLLY